MKEDIEVKEIVKEVKAKTKKKIKKAVTAKYNKFALLHSKLWKADLINAFLEDDKFYTVHEAEQIINKKLKGDR